MSNPWNKKNPLMSMWLSSANRSVAAARGRAAAQAKRQTMAAQLDSAQALLAFWMGAVAPKARQKRS